MAFPAAAVANEFLDLAYGRQDLTPMKLQKLVYFAHGWYLATTNEPLISERIEAWQWGPVIPSLYRQFKEYGDNPIGFPVLESRYEAGRRTFGVPKLDNTAGPTDDVARARQVIRKVWEIYGHYTPSRLSNATHAEGSPWREVYREDSRHDVISDDRIKRYFRNLAHAR